MSPRNQVWLGTCWSRTPRTHGPIAPRVGILVAEERDVSSGGDFSSEEESRLLAVDCSEVQQPLLNLGERCTRQEMGRQAQRPRSQADGVASPCGEIADVGLAPHGLEVGRLDKALRRL